MKEKDIQTQLNDLQKQISNLENSITRKSSPAKLRAEKKYYSTITPYSLRFNKNETDLGEHLNSHPNKAKYLKTLIAKDMGYKTGEHYTGLVPSEEFREEWEEDRKFQLIRSNLAKCNSWQELNDYVDNNEISDDEGKEIECLFYISDNPTGIGFDMFAVGCLPLGAGNKKTIMRKVKDIIENAPFDVDINGDKFDEEFLQKKLLKKSSFGNNDSKLNKHIDFYKIDDEAILNVFKIDTKG